MNQSRINETVIVLALWNFTLSVALIWVGLTSAQHTIDIRTTNTVQEISHESQFESLMEIAEAVGKNTEAINSLLDADDAHLEAVEGLLYIIEVYREDHVESVAEIYQGHIVRLSAYHMGDQ